MTLPQAEGARTIAGSVLQRWPIAAVAGAIWALAALQFALRDPLTSNELDTLLTARRLVDPGFLAGDWFLSLDQGPRRPFQVLLSPLVSALPLQWAAVVGRLLGYAALAWALARLAVRLGIGPALAVVLGGLFVRWEQSIAGGEWLFGTVESKVGAYALVLFGLEAWIADKRTTAVALFGAATTLHVLVGGQATLALGVLAVWSLRTDPRPWRHWAALAVWWLVAAGPALLIVGQTLTSPAPVGSGPDMAWIYVVFRTPHHSDPRTWSIGWRTYAVGLTMLAALTLAPRWLRERPAARAIGVFGVAALVPFALGIAAAQLPNGHKILQFLPFRVGGAVLPLLGLLLFGALWAQRVPTVPRDWLPRLAALWVVVQAALPLPGYLQVWHDFPRGGRPVLPREAGLALQDAATWLAQNTAPTATVLCSPALESLGWLAERPVVASYKQVPPGRAEVVAWYHRIVDLAGGVQPTARGNPLLGELDTRFEALPLDHYGALSHRYGAQSLVIRRADLPLPVLYANAHWRVYALTP